jgi:hypothetical protein
MARAQNLHFGACLCGSQDFKALNLLVFSGRQAFFHFGPVELRLSGRFFFKAKNPSLSQDITREL